MNLMKQSKHRNPDKGERFVVVTFAVKDYEHLYRLIWLQENFAPSYARVVDIDYGWRAEHEALRRWMR